MMATWGADVGISEPRGPEAEAYAEELGRERKPGHAAAYFDALGRGPQSRCKQRQLVGRWG